MKEILSVQEISIDFNGNTYKESFEFYQENKKIKCTKIYSDYPFSICGIFNKTKNYIDIKVNLYKLNNGKEFVKEVVYKLNTELHVFSDVISNTYHNKFEVYKKNHKYYVKKKYCNYPLYTLSGLYYRLTDSIRIRKAIKEINKISKEKGLI